MKRQILSVLTAVCLILTLMGGMVLPAAAQELPYARDMENNPEAGVFQVSAQQDLEALAKAVNSGSNMAGITFLQTADISLTGDFTPIGTYAHPFAGTYDGGGYTISGLNIDSGKYYQGFFGYNSGTIRNVTLDESCSVTGGAYTGSIAGYNVGSIVNCITNASVSCAQSVDTESYKIMTQNLWIHGEGEYSVAKRQPRIQTRIYNNSPDIIAFQEGNTAWVDYLKDGLDGYTFLFKYRANSSKEATPVAYKTERFEQVESGHFWLSETPDTESKGWGSKYYRICTYVVLRDRENGQMLALFSTHLDLYEESRNGGAKLIHDRLLALVEKYDDLMAFAAGDFNADVNSQAYSIMLAGGMADARYMTQDSSDLGTFSGDITQTWAETASTIDFIITNNENVAVTKFEVLAELMDGYRLSDHNGLQATFHSAGERCFGGIAGVNTGEIRYSVSYADVNGEKEAGTLIGRNKGVAEDVYYGESGICAVGSGDASGCVAVSEAVAEMVWKLNQSAGGQAFAVVDGEPAVVGGRDLKAPVRLLVNGTAYYMLPGETFSLDTTGFTNPVCGIDGVYSNELVTEITVPEVDVVVTVIERAELPPVAKAQLAAEDAQRVAQQAAKDAEEVAKAAQGDDTDAGASAELVQKAQGLAEITKQLAQQAKEKAEESTRLSKIAQEAAEKGEMDAATQAETAAASASEAAVSAAEAATCAADAVAAVKAAQEAWCEAEDARDNAAKAEKEALQAAAQTELELRKIVLLLELDEYLQTLLKKADTQSKDALTKAAAAAAEAIEEAPSVEAAVQALEIAKAELDAADQECPSGKYTDVKPDGWYHEAVDFMVAEGYMNGVSETLFGVDGTATRAQLVTILYRMEGEPSVVGVSHSFQDVQADAWYSDAVAWAVEAGIINGVTDTSFVPDALVTREQTVTILWRHDGMQKAQADNLARFNDRNEISGYAVEAMNWAVESGLVSGVTQTVLAPHGTATRAQISTVLMRYCQS